jgi:hypothetical protein
LALLSQGERAGTLWRLWTFLVLSGIRLSCSKKDWKVALQLGFFFDILDQNELNGYPKIGESEREENKATLDEAEDSRASWDS